ncbi:recombinase family protein [Bacillus sp. V2I10]|uniref:recombinase family protein n=1 Tax=Bacillus sp. V2I10 TaxID=3042276 RepID=UPI002781A8EB|nr:recombinase family protein [Bacillus sp. V2I10]MDQ0862237.1 DNA invertase Pin-like site-specific DNA recombinase [Bacillus sp. V2I10]
MKFGYARVSTQDQSLSLQLDALTHYGVDQNFEEKESGKKKNRPQLDELLKVLRKGDTVIVYKLDRISRSTKHLIELMEYFESDGIHFVSIQDKIDTTTAMGRFFFRMLASIAELERDIISERTKDGLTAARARGRKGGRPKVESKKIELAMKMYQSKDYSLSQIKVATGIGATTLYRYLEKKA